MLAVNVYMDKTKYEITDKAVKDIEDNIDNISNMIKRYMYPYDDDIYQGAWEYSIEYIYRHQDFAYRYYHLNKIMKYTIQDLRSNRGNTRLNNSAISINQKLPDTDNEATLLDTIPSPINLEEDIVNNMYCKQCIDIVKQELGDKQADIIDMYMHSYKIREIRDKHYPSKSTAYTHQVIKKILRFLKTQKKLQF